MRKIVFNDATNMCILESDTPVSVFESDYINNYIKTSANMAASKAWKNAGYGAKFRGEAQQIQNFDERIDAFINSVNFVSDTEVVYTFTINDVSGIYKKNLTLTKDSESHLIHSKDMEFLSSSYNLADDTMVMTVKKDAVTSQIAAMKLADADYHLVTSGDCKDENPSFCPNKENTILYNSYGVGRAYNGNFIEYGDSVINSINLTNNNIVEVKSEKGYSLIKPKYDSKGNLYYIRRPTKPKKKGNLFLDILLIPVKLVVAIYRFLETFVLMFTGKTFTHKDDNPTKDRKMNSAQIYVDGNLINADKEYKRNQNNADKIVGIIPSCWQLMRMDSSGETSVVRDGIVDFSISDDDKILCSDGRNILLISEKSSVTDSQGNNKKANLKISKSAFKATKLASAKLCTTLSVGKQKGAKTTDIFGL